MQHLHPASILLLGFALLLAVASRNGTTLMVAVGGLSVVALVFARAHFFRILRRSRWLLVTMFVLFGWMTPGTPLDGLPGATSEGLLLAAENVARITVAIAVVALILGALPLPSLVYGLRTLLAPFARCGDFRDRLAVRLMLTLQEVEATRTAGTPGTSEPARRIPLTASAFGWADYLVLALCGGLLLFAGLS